MIVYIYRYSHVLESKEALVKEMKNHGVAESEVEDVERQLLEYSHELQNKASSSASSTNDSIDMSVLDDILGDNKRSDHASEEDAPAAVSTSSASNHNFSPEEWNKLVRQHVKLPKTSLDMERHNFYNQVEYDSFESAKSEDDLIRFKTLRYVQTDFYRVKYSVINDFLNLLFKLEWKMN